MKVYFRIKVFGFVFKYKVIGNVDLGLGCLIVMIGCCWIFFFYENNFRSLFVLIFVGNWCIFLLIKINKFVVNLWFVIRLFI